MVPTGYKLKDQALFSYSVSEYIMYIYMFWEQVWGDVRPLAPHAYPYLLPSCITKMFVFHVYKYYNFSPFKSRPRLFPLEKKKLKKNLSGLSPISDVSAIKMKFFLTAPLCFHFKF